MPTLNRNYAPVPYASQPRYVPNYGTLGELMGIRARNSQQGWAQLAHAFNQFVETRNQAEVAKAALAQREQARQDDLKLKRDEMAARDAERKETLRLRQEADTRQRRMDAEKYGADAADAIGYGPIDESMVDPIMQSSQAGRVRYAFGPGTAQGPELMPSAAQKRQMALDAHAKAVAERANADRIADNARQSSQFEETKRHNKAMEARQPRPLAGEVIQGPNGPLIVNKETGRTSVVIGPDGQPVKTAMSSQERMDSRKFSKAAPVLRGIGELSERINTLQGVYAKAVGEVERQKAKVNLNDDVAEYEALVSGFTPMIARALGHTGVLTEQDVQSVKALFPRPADSKALRDRKINRMMTIIGELEGVEGVPGVSPQPSKPKVTRDADGNLVAAPRPR